MNATKKRLSFSVRTCTEECEVCENVIGIRDAPMVFYPDDSSVKDILIKAFLMAKRLLPWVLMERLQWNFWRRAWRQKHFNMWFISTVLLIAMSSLLKLQSRTAACFNHLLLCANHFKRVLAHTQSKSCFSKIFIAILELNRKAEITKFLLHQFCQQEDGQRCSMPQILPLKSFLSCKNL